MNPTSEPIPDLSGPAYQRSVEDVLTALRTSEHGLTSAEAQRRLGLYGDNEIAFRRVPGWVRFLRQFNDPMVILLMITATVTGGLTLTGSHMLPDTIVIASVVLFNALLGFIQEGKAEGALMALHRMLAEECLVVRDGERERVPAKSLVPGDIVILESGDKIPADLRLLVVNSLQVDESSLTGESIPTEKTAAALDNSPRIPADQHNMGFSGTFVSRGSAVGVVIATAEATVFGQIAHLVKEARTTETPLQRQLQEFVRSLIIATLILGGFNFVYGLWLGYDMSYSFLGTVSLIVAAIPEMLPALVTSILALASMVMARRKALIRKLPAAETLGATSVICSDKTGTLTENKMTVTRVYAGGQIYKVTGDGGSLEGHFLLEDSLQLSNSPALQALLKGGYHCNNARVHSDNAVGDPTEIALRIAGIKGGLVDGGVRRLIELPFDTTVKYMAVLVEEQGSHRIYVKGAPEVILGMCCYELAADGRVIPLDEDTALQHVTHFSGSALRTLAVASQDVTADHCTLDPSHLENLCFLGLEGMIDPPKASAIAAVAACAGAGIRTVMITGDHPNTAQAVARQLGIPADRVVTGAELGTLDEHALEAVVEEVSVYARVAPEHKSMIAEALQKNGHVVAMTGDGVNDAPALKSADIGIAMGQEGTEVAKQAADMVLQDDNFATIVAAVEEGRHTWNNLQKAILYTLPTNAAQALLIMGAVLMAASVPIFSARFVLEPVQILWINLLDSVLLTMPLMMERKEPGLLSIPPRPATTRIVTPLFLQRVVVMGMAIALPGFFIYYHFGNTAVGPNGEILDALLLTQAQTAAFWAILLGHLGYLFSARSISQSFFSLNPFSNPWLIAGVVLSIAIRFIPTVFPPAEALFRTAEFPSHWWSLILLCWIPSFAVIEIDKLLRKLHSNRINVNSDERIN